MEIAMTARSAVRIVTENPRWASSSANAPGEGNRAPDLPQAPPASRSNLLCWSHPEWALRFPWLTQGTTARGPGPGGGDFRLFEEGEKRPNEDIWMELARRHGYEGIAHSRQVHGPNLLVHETAPEGLLVGEDADGHLSRAPGALLAVTLADCVPVFMVDPQRRAIGILHAGWRGVASGILEAGISALQGEFGSPSEDILIHLGPAICGSCYEVGPEVHRALGLGEPPEPTPVDLRSLLMGRALDMGILWAHLTCSSFCTLCGSSPFFSSRGGATQRQVGFLGICPF